MSGLNPNLSIDCVIFSYDDKQLRVLLVERNSGSEKLKLPGGLVYNNELLQDAAARVLKELTCIENVSLKQFEVLDSLDRMLEEDGCGWKKLPVSALIVLFQLHFTGLSAQKDQIFAIQAHIGLSYPGLTIFRSITKILFTELLFPSGKV
jgi:ADP-ribose pyrophosphatase YjhB (NUDIX family)